MPNHPAIPPNCKHFVCMSPRMNGDHIYGLKVASMTWPIGTKQLRPITAAVAEVAWYREAERLEAKSSMYLDLILASEKNALAWRSWGERKEDPNAE